ncbi:response regulator transcription factor [Sorangium sp. So ce1024]|uniref:response regulator transcription factor n=1 Tax=unclassified Sorangium TaxID=2621164 RepID=UPI003EFCFE7C
MGPGSAGAKKARIHGARGAKYSANVDTSRDRSRRYPEPSSLSRHLRGDPFVASTLLAVDDSVTMRKVLEITFAGQDFRVVTASSADAALQKLKSDKPDLVIADVTLEPKNGYELCKAIKQASPATPVLILSSKQNPFDPAKGSSAQADDHMDKPFDTQQMIDKVKKLLASRGEAKPAAAAAAPAAAAATPARAPAAAAQPAGAAASPLQRAKTLIYTPNAPATSAAPAQASVKAAAPAGASSGLPQTTMAFSPTPVSGVPKTASGPAAVAATASAQVNGQMAGKLEGLGLTAEQAEAVMALSRDVVERVVWEVVPVLAETLIKEEIARLTK